MIQGHVFARVWEFKSPPGQFRFLIGIGMAQILKILTFVLLLCVAACERSTLGYAGTSKDAKAADAPDYTVKPTLNPPVKTM